MYGIVNLDQYETLLNRNTHYTDLVNRSSVKVVSSIKNIESCYSGDLLDFLFSSLNEHVCTIQNINEVLLSYLDLLNAVKKNYALQNISFNQQINNMSRKM